MRHYFLTSRNPSIQTNTQFRATWNYQNPNSLKTNILETTSPLPSKSSHDRFSDETKSNTNSSSFNTPILNRRTFSRIRPSIENNPDIEGIRLNFASLREKINKLDSIINDNAVILKTPKKKEKPRITKLNIAHIKEKVNNSKFICNSESNRKKKISFIKSMKKEENNKYNKISSFNIDYPVCLTEGNLDNEKLQKKKISEFMHGKQYSCFVPSKQTNLNYVIGNKKK